MKEKEKQYEVLGVVALVAFIIGMGAGYFVFYSETKKGVTQEERLTEANESEEENYHERMVEGIVTKINEDEPLSIEMDIVKPERFEGKSVVLIDENETDIQKLYLEITCHGEVRNSREEEGSFDQIEEEDMVIIYTEEEFSTEETVVATRVLIILEQEV